MVTSSRQDPIVMIYSEWNSLRLARTMWTSVKIQDGFSMVYNEKKHEFGPGWLNKFMGQRVKQ